MRPDHLSRFAADLLAEGYAPATVQGVYATLTSCLRHALRRGVIGALPLPPDGPGIPTPRPREHGLSLAQVEEVVDRMPGVWRDVGELILLTGLRWGRRRRSSGRTSKAPFSGSAAPATGQEGPTPQRRGQGSGSCP